jgi:hypothetical protein
MSLVAWAEAANVSASDNATNQNNRINGFYRPGTRNGPLSFDLKHASVSGNPIPRETPFAPSPCAATPIHDSEIMTLHFSVSAQLQLTPAQ